MSLPAMGTTYFSDSIQLSLRNFWFWPNSWLTIAFKNWFKSTHDSKWLSGIWFKLTHDSNGFQEFRFKSTHDSKSFPEFWFKSTHNSKGFPEFWFKSTHDSKNFLAYWCLNEKLIRINSWHIEHLGKLNQFKSWLKRLSMELTQNQLTTQADPHVLIQIDSWLKGKNIWFWVDLWCNSESYPFLDSTIISRHAGFIARVSFCLDKSTTRLLYNGLISPNFFLNDFVCSWDQIILPSSTSYQLQKKNSANDRTHLLLS